MGLQWPEVAPTRRSTPHPRLRHPSSVCGGAAAYTAAVRRAERKHAVGTASLSSQHTNTQCALNEAHEYTMHFSDTAVQQLTAAQKVSSIRRVSCRTSGKNDFRHSRHSNSYITQDTAGHHRSHYTNGCADDSDDDGLNGAACTARPRRCSVQGGLCLAAPSRIRSGWGAGARSSVGSPGHYR